MFSKYLFDDVFEHSGKGMALMMAETAAAAGRSRLQGLTRAIGWRFSWNHSKKTLASIGIAAALGAAFTAGAVPGVSTVAPAHACAAGGVASSAAKSFISAANSGSASAFSSALRRHVDMTRVTRFALGRHRRKVKQSEFPGFTRAATRYVAGTLAQFSGRFNARAFKVNSCSGSTVRGTLIRGNGKSQPVVWKISGGKVEDVNIQNLWLGQTLRSNFNSIIKNGGIGSLYRRVGYRNLSNVK